jgi:hypothetical protein
MIRQYLPEAAPFLPRRYALLLAIASGALGCVGKAGDQGGELPNTAAGGVAPNDLPSNPGAGGVGGASAAAGGGSSGSASGTGGATTGSGGGALGGSGGVGGETAPGGGAFVHPGLLHVQQDLELIKSKVAAKAEPYLSGYDVFRGNGQSASSYGVRGGCAELGRNPNVCSSEAETDGNAAYQNALMWTISGDRAYADKAIQILNTWSANLMKISGADAILAAGIDGFKFVNAAEILRYTNAGWDGADIDRAEKMFKNVFYPVIQDFATFANGNWSAACLKTMIGIGVFTNDRAMFERAIDWYSNGTDNGSVIHYVINETGQVQESGRDQTHTQLGLGFLAEAAEIAWHQGIDLYGAFDNRLLKGFEYTASYNLGNDVPFEEFTDTTGKYHQTAISADTRGAFRPIFEMVYNHYLNRRSVSCPFTQQVVERIRPEGAAFQADHPGFGTLLFTKAPGSQ